MMTYTAPQAGEEKTLLAIKLEDDSSQATVSPNGEVRTRLSMKWQVTSKGLTAIWIKTFSDVNTIL